MLYALPWPVHLREFLRMTYKYCNTIGKGGCVTIPIEMRLSAGLVPHALVSFEQVAPNAVLVRREELKDQEDAPAEMPSLRELLESLSPEQQEAARCYLAVYCLGGNS